jgi:N6-adenosine-specific RNA methylase IME4
MPLGEIAGLRPPADDNAHLYLWTTNGFMREAYDVADAWGFEIKTILTWTKVKGDDPGTPSMKTGYYFRGATEHCLFGVRGSLRLQTRRGVSTAILHPRLPHSVKPEVFYELVEECSPGPYLELFARRTRPGWDVWGNEVQGGITW